MGLATRIVPVLLARGDQLVKGKSFNSWRSVGHVTQAAKIYAHRAVDEIVLLDIAATPEGRGPDLAQVEKIAADFYTPLTVGGGVRRIEDVRDLLNAGADKVAICTAAFDATLIQEAAYKFGSQAIVASVDTQKGYVYSQSGQWPHERKPADWAKQVAAWGAGEILLTSIEREGTLTGYDLPLIRKVAKAVDVPVIANGGAGTYAHMEEAIQAGANAVAAGAMFQFTDQTPKGAAKYLASKGIETR